MSRPPPRLGRGLASLFQDTASASNTTSQLAVTTMQPGPFQPRGEIDPASLAGLIESIQSQGVLQPLLVRPHPGQPALFQIIAGERRWRAAQAAGLHYRWTALGPRPLNILQTIGNGCGFLDYDNSGNLSVLLVGTDHVALFKGDGQGHFTDVSHALGLDTLKGHFLGCAVGDYDNDGYPDLFVAGVHRNTLYHNNGDGTFTDVSDHAGLNKPDTQFGPMWAITGVWVDANNDGLLDLFVVNYLQWDYATEPLCAGPPITAARGRTKGCPISST